MKRRNGFTLAELLIVAAILAVLAAIAIPMFTRQLSSAREAACLANRRGLLSQLASWQVFAPGETLEDVAGTAEGREWLEACVCPSGGTITVKKNEVRCSEHAALLGPVEMMLSQFDALVKLGTESGVKYNSNDEFRRVYLEKYGSYPQVRINGTIYYAQPCWDKKSEDVIIFAKTNQTNGWYTGYIYDPDGGKWYTGPAFSVNDQSWETVKNTMTEKGWTVAENVEELD